MDDVRDRIVARHMNMDDIENEATLRPKWLNEYIGQEKAKEKLGIFIQAFVPGSHHSRLS